MTLETKGSVGGSSCMEFHLFVPRKLPLSHRWCGADRPWRVWIKAAGRVMPCRAVLAPRKDALQGLSQVPPLLVSPRGGRPCQPCT